MANQCRILSIGNVYAAPLSGQASNWDDGGKNALNFTRDGFSRSVNSTYKQYGLDYDARLTSGLINYAPSWAGLVIQNYEQNFTPANVTIYSDDEPTFVSPVTNHGSINMVDALGTGFLIKYLGGSTKRYWLFEFNSIAAFVNVAMAMVGYYWEIKARWDYGSPLGLGFANRRIITPNADDVVVNVRDNPYIIHVRRFELMTDADKGALEDAFKWARGSAYPFFILDTLAVPGLMANYKMFKFTDDELIFEEADFGLWNCDVSLREVPFILANSAF